MAGTRLEGSPAWGAVGPLSDLMNLAVELASPSLVDEGLLAEATRTAFPGLSGVVPGFGLEGRTATGAWASRSRTARRRTGPDRGTRPGPSVISAARAASSGWILTPGSPAWPSPTATSATGPSGPGHACPTTCSRPTPGDPAVRRARRDARRDHPAALVRHRRAVVRGPRVCPAGQRDS